MDDTRTLSVGWFFDRVPNEMEPFEQDRIPYWYAPVKDPRTGRWITTHVMNQDFAAWVGQGAVADRSREHLGASDSGVIMMRKRILEEAEGVAHGGEPKALIRDPEKNGCVRLPIIGRAYFVNGYPRADAGRPRGGTPGVTLGADFIFLSGQPREIRAACRRAMGLPVEPAPDVRSQAAPAPDVRSHAG